MTKKCRNEGQLFVWNFPLDLTFKSTNCHGCKSIVSYWISSLFKKKKKGHTFQLNLKFRIRTRSDSGICACGHLLGGTCFSSACIC